MILILSNILPVLDNESLKKEQKEIDLTVSIFFILTFLYLTRGDSLHKYLMFFFLPPKIIRASIHYFEDYKSTIQIGYSNKKKSYSGTNC